MPGSISLPHNISPILGAIRAVPIPPKPGAPGEPPPPPPVEPFITISRQAGAGAWSLAQQLVDSLNASNLGERPWTCWERELIHKVAADHNMSERLIESLGETRHTWFGDLLDSLSFSDSSDEAKVYRRVAQSIRALAKTGRVVIVGRGGVFITRHLPGGIHVRLVAPLEHRVEFMAKQLHFSKEAAAAYVKEMDHNRHAFYRRYWPHESLNPETFALTINTAAVELPTSVEMLRALVNQAVASQAARG